MLDRRTLLRSGAAAALAAPLGVIGAQALPFRAATPASTSRNFRSAGRRRIRPPIAGAPRKLKLSWNRRRGLLAPVPIAIEYGFFQKHNLDVELVNYSGSTDQLLEAIATGKSDAGLGMALRWLKPLEQGFDVKIAAGTHGGCMRVLTRTSSGVEKLADLKGKIVASAISPDPTRTSSRSSLPSSASTPTRTSIGAPIPGTFSTSRSRKARFRRSWRPIRSRTSG
jgi:NitT/TauT family transport system substrate-binding protein